MKQLPLDFCSQPAHAENARPMESEEIFDHVINSFIIE